jgi:hypothetical protein
MPYFIDPPVPWATLDEWREYLADLEGELDGNPGDESLERAIKEAREHIAKAEKEAPGP